MSRHERIGDRRELRFSVPARRGSIAVHRAEIADAIDKRHAHDPALGEADKGLVHRILAVGVEVAGYVPDYLGALSRSSIGVKVQVVKHGIHDAALHRLQAVAHIRQRPRRNDRKGVSQISASRLLHD